MQNSLLSIQLAISKSYLMEMSQKCGKTHYNHRKLFSLADSIASTYSHCNKLNSFHQKLINGHQ